MNPTPEPLPDWRDPKVGGARVRVALWLLAEVGEGNLFTKQQLRSAIPEVEQVDRRMRDLRSAGWEIATYRDAAGIKAGDLRLQKVGLPVWEKQHRQAGLRQVSATVRRRVMERDGYRCVRCGITSNEEYPGVPGKRARLTLGHVNPHKHGSKATEEDLVTECDRCNEPVKHLTGVQTDHERVWDEIVELPMRDKRELASWIANDRRPNSRLEQAWSKFRQLPGALREDLRERLDKLLNG